MKTRCFSYKKGSNFLLILEKNQKNKVEFMQIATRFNSLARVACPVIQTVVAVLANMTTLIL